MRKWIALFGALLFAAGCGAKGGQPTSAQSTGAAASSTKSTQTTQQSGSKSGSSFKKVLRESDPTRYLNVTLAARGNAERKLNLISVEQAIKAFQAAEGRWPKSIDELRNNGYNIPNPPAGLRYKYDPNTGKISLEKSAP